MLWDDNVLTFTDQLTLSRSITAKVTFSLDGTTWFVIAIYSPHQDRDKSYFLRELSTIKSHVTCPWLVLGDFNLIYIVCDKNNLNLNSHMTRQFRATINDCELNEVKLAGRRFTWSNEQDNPTLVRLDRIFCTFN